jgi:uncharacterized LabA/DUF88 family protein
VTSKTPGGTKTAVYIDGYNLYYGRLRGTSFKWLDVVCLFENLLIKRDQHEILERVNFFTAPALAKLATHGSASTEAQQAYHRALKAKHGEKFETINGSHAFDESGTLLPKFIAGTPFDRRSRVRVWKIEEKKTDVNLAIWMYRDISKGLYDRIVLVSNDSDQEPALHAIRADFPNVLIGVVIPVHQPHDKTDVNRRSSGSLTKLADWTIDYLTDDELRAAQLPDVVPTKKKPSIKPRHW